MLNNMEFKYSALRIETGKCTLSRIGDFLRHTACYSQTKISPNHWGTMIITQQSRDENGNNSDASISG